MADLSPLRRRMIEDMTVRTLSPATQRSYISAVSKFSRYFGRSPDRLELEDVRAFQVHLVSTGISWPALNQIAIGADIFGRHQPGIVTQRCEFAAQVIARSSVVLNVPQNSHLRPREPQDADLGQVRRNLLKRLQPFPAHGRLEVCEPSHVTARSGKVRDDTDTFRIGNPNKTTGIELVASRTAFRTDVP
jgi:hypothetical protein